MRLRHDADATFGGIGQKSRHGDLGSGMEMNFGLFDVHKLSRRGAQKGYRNGNACDTPTPTSAMLIRSRAPPCFA